MKKNIGRVLVGGFFVSVIITVLGMISAIMLYNNPDVFLMDGITYNLMDVLVLLNRSRELSVSIMNWTLNFACIAIVFGVGSIAYDIKTEIESQV